MHKKPLPPRCATAQTLSNSARPCLEAPDRETSSQPAAGNRGRSLLLSAKQTAELYGVSERKFHAMRRAGLVPPAVCLGERTLRWSRAEIEQSIIDLPRQVTGSIEPEHLRAARERRGQ